jgi:hypothetical protein
MRMIQTFFVGIIAELVFLLYQVQGIYTGDSGDVVTAAATMGVAHPPGYPLYTLIGYMLSKLPFFTVSWRVSLLSSIPHALVVALVFFLVKSITKRSLPALIASWILTCNYLFFLYSVTPEVFALFDVFVVGFIVLVYLYIDTKLLKYVFFMSFVYGLSLTNHHLILFLSPVYGYCAYRVSSRHKTVLPIVVAVFVIGLLPYLYVPIAASRGPIIDWDHPTTLSNFVRLVTRADYGTFISNSSFKPEFGIRFLSIWAYMLHIIADFTVIGILLIGIGIYGIWKKKRQFAIIWIVSLVLIGPVFLFYASFPLYNNYGLGTFERFLLPSYVLFSIALGVGLSLCINFVQKFLHTRATTKQYATLFYVFVIIVLIYPLSMTFKTLGRFNGIATDYTANNLGQDFLDTVPPHAILLMGADTSLFVTQYMRYALGYRPDVVLIHASRLPQIEYRQMVAHMFPSIRPIPDDTKAPITNFIVENIKKSRVFSNVVLPIGTGYTWVPYGLLYEVHPADTLPVFEDTVNKNNALWSTYHNPKAGILSVYEHLMLSDALDVYGNSRIEFGKMLMKAQRYQDAKEQFNQSVLLGGDTSIANAYEQLGLSELFLKNCDGALAAFEQAKKNMHSDKTVLILYTSLTYRDCVGDQGRAQKLYDEYQKKILEQETPLDQL